MTSSTAVPPGSRTAVVVGSGPNGLAAAIRLAQAGVRVTVLEGASTPGGGTRTSELTLPGVLHDVCSAIHPLGAGSPYFARLPLAEHGLRWRWPEIDLAHPLDDGSAGALAGDVDRTAPLLGADGDRWRQVFGPVAARFPDLAGDVLGPIVHVPRHPLGLLGFGLRAAPPASLLAKTFRTPQARALFIGCAAHLMQPLDRPLSSAVGTMLIAAGHRYGWPVAEGGSQAITTALVGVLESLGGEVVLDHPVRSRADLPRADVTLFDTTPTGMAEILGRDAGRPTGPRRLGPRRPWRYGPAAYKVDLAVRGGVPWRAEVARRAGTVHLGGSAESVIAAESAAARGVMPERPFILVAQQHVADPTRSVGDVHPVWAYAHVPHGHADDATDVILDELERHAPGVRDRIVGQHVMTPRDFEDYNPNYVGGDIGGGANGLVQLLARPRLSPDPYATDVPGVYLCSSSTPPGGGVHGMCGLRAAESALRRLAAR